MSKTRTAIASIVAGLFLLVLGLAIFYVDGFLSSFSIEKGTANSANFIFAFPMVLIGLGLIVFGIWYGLRNPNSNSMYDYP